MHLLVTEPQVLIEARAIVDAELDAIEAAASRFNPGSEINALPEGIRTPVSPVLAGLLDAALTAARFTDGDVDPTIGAALVNLGYDRDIADIDPSTPLVMSTVMPAHWSMIEFDGSTVMVPKGVTLDIGATAKAVAADICAERVHGETGSGTLVNLGGDIATAGSTPRGGWQVRVEDTAVDPACVVALEGGLGLATSSTTRRQWRRGGDLMHHIVDPRTGHSADPVWRSVSVAAQTCLAANAMSTAAIIRGHRAPDWLAALSVPARFVDRDHSVRTVAGWPQR
jgi:thiamine biosynthesis lipoprotein